MTREQIRAAALEYAEHETDFRKKILKEVDSDNYAIRKKDCMEDFLSGIEWFINSVWHDNSVRPGEDCDVFVETKHGIIFDRYDTDYNELDRGTDWEMEVIKWVYVSDLLPERKEETK